MLLHHSLGGDEVVCGVGVREWVHRQRRALPAHRRYPLRLAALLRSLERKLRLLRALERVLVRLVQRERLLEQLRRLLPKPEPELPIPSPHKSANVPGIHLDGVQAVLDSGVPPSEFEARRRSVPMVHRLFRRKPNRLCVVLERLFVLSVLITCHAAIVLSIRLRIIVHAILPPLLRLRERLRVLLFRSQILQHNRVLLHLSVQPQKVWIVLHSETPRLEHEIPQLLRAPHAPRLALVHRELHLIVLESIILHC
mmetsp:Transcript_30861/g.100467  ORF Transcript_30861/g.100467 Transcript_30861/m.100467 type:complete len:254 (-) Transcript_30861:59-820(-)